MTIIPPYGNPILKDSISGLRRIPMNFYDKI
jgi:hypothetical protein